MLGKKLINAGPVGSSGPTPSNYFNTVLYTGNGGTQRIGGYINRGAVFNGSSSYITIPIDKLTNTFSFSTWLYLDDLSTSYRWVFGNWNSTTQDLYVMIRNTGTIEVNPDGNNGTVEFGSSGAFSTNTWHHLAVSMSAGTYTVYLDGTSLGSGSTTNTTFDNGYNYQIGKTPNSSINEWSGKIDQFRLFDKAISSSEVTTLYGETHASTTKSTTDIFDDASGVALYQLDGNANDTGGVSGYIGEGAIFNGSSSKIVASSYNMNLSTVSVSYWFKDKILLGLQFYKDSQNHVAFGSIGSNIGMYARIGNSFNHTASTTSRTQSGWNHLVFVLGGGNIKVYLNGNTTPIINTTKTYNISATKLNISTLEDAGGPYYYANTLDQVRIFDKALSSSEVTTLYGETASSNITISDLVAYYPMEGTSLDQEGSYHGTDTNVEYNYSGTATNVTYQEATNFSPDLVWIKSRSNATSNFLFDSIRGTSNWLASDLTLGQNSASGVTSFEANGFDLGTNGSMNGSSQTYAAWCFNAGTDAAASNTDGSITSTVKANQDAGFSIVGGSGNTYFGGSVGHGLSQAPEFIIYKETTATNAWFVYHKDLTTPNNSYLQLQDTAAQANYGQNIWDVTSTTFGSDLGITRPGVAYCFHSVDEIQKVGSYTGNGSASGPIVETGFEPAFVMIKNTDGGDSWDRWYMSDNKRLTDGYLYANESLAEQPYQAIKMLSNGFEVITNDTGVNQSSNTYIYLAIAADPDTTTPTVEDSFEVVTYTGNAGTQSIDTGFKPDLVWTKQRNGTGFHLLIDSVRGNTKEIYSNSTSAEGTSSNTITSFDSNGYSIGSNGGLNGSSKTYVAWCWKAGDHDDNLPQINTEGSIDSVVSVNDAAGFSIVKYTGNNIAGATIGHGLSSAPDMIILKNTDTTDNWTVQTSDLTYTDYIDLNSTNAATTNSSVWYAAPTSSVFSFGANPRGNGSGNDIIAYCFTSITGYQKIGSYTGAGSSGKTITTGFRPRWVMIKRTDAANSWTIIDSTRDTTDPYSKVLWADLSDAEADGGSTTAISFSDTGFSMSTSAAGSSINANNGTYIYLAIA